MVEISPKNAQSYLGIYQNLLERAKKLDQSSADNQRQPDLVDIQHTDESEAHLKLMADLKTGSLSAHFKPGQYAQTPESKISFLPQGPTLHVSEQSAGEQTMVDRSFDIEMATSTIQNLQEHSSQAPKTLPMDKQTRAELQYLACELGDFGYTISDSFPSK